MQLPKFQDHIQVGLQRTQAWLDAKDKERPWVKFVLVSIVLLLVTFACGNNSLWDYYKLLERERAILKEINEIKPKLEADSLRLNELKNLGEEIEAIARERYLMKSPGEEIFIIRPDSNQQQP